MVDKPMNIGMDFALIPVNDMAKCVLFAVLDGSD